jgi:AAA domain (Cdc48 subfamily)
LNLFDEAWVCDQRGARAYGNKSIFILTSNVGQRMIAEMVQQGKPSDEIASRMKEALSQIRHSKSDQPVFTPEFLARIKRLIVFNPLDKAAMESISRKLAGELVQTWASKRDKTLVIPDSLSVYIADQGHRMNERSGGKEGGPDHPQTPVGVGGSEAPTRSVTTAPGVQTVQVSCLGILPPRNAPRNRAGATCCRGSVPLRESDSTFRFETGHSSPRRTRPGRPHGTIWERTCPCPGGLPRLLFRLGDIPGVTASGRYEVPAPLEGNLQPFLDRPARHLANRTNHVEEAQ